MLNTEAFLLIAGYTEHWDQDLREKVAVGIPLPRVQEDQHGRGLRSAELLRSKYGWYVRSGTGLDGWQILYTPERAEQLERVDRGFWLALEWGKAWVAADPQNREFYARKATLKTYGFEAVERPETVRRVV